MTHTMVRWMLRGFSLIAHTDYVCAQQEAWWLTGQVQYNVNSKWGAVADINHRLIHANQWHSLVSAVRLGATCFLPQYRSVTAGVAWFGAHQQGEPANMIHEKRIWEQFMAEKQHAKAKSFHRIRLEQRFIEKGLNLHKYISIHRIRYMYSMEWPLGKSIDGQTARWWWLAANEIMFQAGDGKVSLFNQNRTITGLHWHINHAVSLQTLYQLMILGAYEAPATTVHVIRTTLIIKPGT